MNFAMSFSIERLIVEVECRPALWDNRTKEYSERLLKRDAWEEVCHALDPNYENYTKAEKCNTAAIIQKKWKGIRDAFLRELKKSSQKGAQTHKPYTYYDNLSFLKPIYESKTKREEEDHEYMVLAEGQEYENEESDGSSSNDNNMSQVQLNKSNYTPRKRKYEEPFFKLLSDHVKNKRMRHLHNDPDRQFLLSLLPDFKNVDPSVRFDLKFEIMSLIKRFKSYNK